MSRHIESLARETLRLGLAGRVAGSHLTSMHSMDNYYVSKLIPLIAEAGVAAIANPLINITIQGRHDTYPKRRGMTRVPELMAAGIDVALGHDCVLDPWYPLGSADMLEVAHMGLHVAQMTGQQAMARVLRRRHQRSGEDPRSRRLRPRAGMPRRLRAAGSARSGRGDTAQGDAARGRAPGPHHRAHAVRRDDARPSGAPGDDALPDQRVSAQDGMRAAKVRRMTLSVIVIAKDEEASIARTLRSVAFADEIVVVDSGSTDRTVDIAREHGAKVTVTADWPGFGPQKNRALDLATGDWVLSLDADEWLTAESRRRDPACRRAATRRTSPPIGCRAARASADASCATRAGGRTTSCGCSAAAARRFSDDVVHERVIVDGTRRDAAPSRSCTRPSSTSRISSTR